MTDALNFTLELEQVQDYEFRVRFDSKTMPDLLVDEPPPLGSGHGPNPARLIAAAVANCLSASLLFCLRKFKNTDTGALRAQVRCELQRNEKGRLRIGRIDATLQLDRPLPSLAHGDRCLEQFEDFCIVTESVRQGIPVGVRVLDGGGAEVFAAGG